MHKGELQVSWWQLYLIVAGGLGLLLLDTQAPFSTTGHEVTECAILVLIFGLSAMWLHANKLGLLQMDEDEEQLASEAYLETHLGQPSAPDAMANRLWGGNHGSDKTAKPLPEQARRDQVP
jgi:hypothetical protein